MSSPTAHTLESKPAEIAAAQAWFDKHYDPRTLAAVCTAKGGKICALLSIPPLSVGSMEVVLHLIQGIIEAET